jgi:hypothetical protein
MLLPVLWVLLLALTMCVFVVVLGVFKAVEFVASKLF